MARRSPPSRSPSAPTQDDDPLPLLNGGERLIEPAPRRPRPFPRPPLRPYAEVRQRFWEGLERLRARFAELPPEMKYRGETVLAFRLHPDYPSAAQEPDHFLALTPGAAKVGSRLWQAPLVGDDAVAPSARLRREAAAGRVTAAARLLFVAVAEEAFLTGFRRVLERSEGSLPRPVKEDLQRLERIDFLAPHERIPPASFPETWKGGRVELVLHPALLTAAAREAHLLHLLGGMGWTDPSRASLRLRSYADGSGPTFVSLRLDPDFSPGALALLRGYNPLRTARPLDLGPFPALRSGPMLTAPKPPLPAPPAPIRVALFDGGFDPSLPLLAGHAGDDPKAGEWPVPAHPDCVAHGTAVAGALLHGPLNPHAARDVLPAPPLSVLGYRVFPLSDPDDLDLYEAIDAMERIVPTLPGLGVRLLNLSFGPRGPISDDNLSRLTYVLDTLAHAHDLLPIVAVGNDGEEPGYGRIQAPADAVNALSVGAYGEYGTQRYSVPYSCRGPGREGAKVKPDLAAFGGCERTPFHLVSARPGLRVLDYGTSFAAPLVVRRCAELLRRHPGLSPALLRALLIHHSRHPVPPGAKASAAPGFDYLLGHGFCPDDPDALLGCPPDTVSVLIDHALPPKTASRLPIPLPPALLEGNKSRVTLEWTLVVQSPVDPRVPVEYTAHGVAATFYPDARLHAYAPPSYLKPAPAPRRVNIEAEADLAAALESARWTRSELPLSKSANTYRAGARLHGGDLRWDTVVRSSITLPARSLHRPFLLLQAHSRLPTANAEAQAPIRFGGILTVRLPGSGEKLYEEVVREYPTLQKMAPVKNPSP
ncbi:Serine protease, subtilisin family [Verrucomicrobium sp. GAS474]|uniref:S8 family peptidase n=1 Tax=Verrucomicrobium sp. GAS474 TaxID=1882831 RepID=UPI00087A2428|nr:S8 family peptidase [Verrucomicrobium sp. GAS474]SDT97847.1 Serine protease, subtilisin family [Verrucomicrobium sp. GAS474]